MEVDTNNIFARPPLHRTYHRATTWNTRNIRMNIEFIMRIWNLNIQ